jgi:carbon storage regulator
MLVLGRKSSQEIIIGDNIRVVVIEVRGDTAQIGIEAPKAVTVHRKEIYDLIQAEGSTSAATTELVMAMQDVIRKATE